MEIQVFIALIAIFSPISCTQSKTEFPFRNIDLHWNDRVEDLVNRLTVDELVLQLAKGGTSPGSGPAPAIPRLGIQPYSWNTECLRGLAAAGPATSFPQAIGLAASFNRDVLFSVAKATSKEARAKFNNYTSQGSYGNHKGISCFSPVVNIMRHPLWGRNQETYGEDPYLSGELGAAYVHGLQGQHSRYIRTNAGCKHFDVHGGPEDKPVSRFSFDAKVTERDWRLTYLPAFYGCIVKGGSLSVMCSYNKINGVPACANKKLLIDILRTEWNFTGYVVADQEALENLVLTHKWKATFEEAAADALLAGTNLEISTNNPNNTFMHLYGAFENKLVTLDQLKAAAKPLFYVRMRLGEFDPPALNPYTSYSLSLIQSKEHRDLSLRAAMQSFVLLQNKGNVLPLQKKRYQAIAVVGPVANSTPDLYGSYSADPEPKYVETPLASLEKMANRVYYVDGCNGTTKCVDYAADEIIQAVSKSDVELIVVCLGVEGEIVIESSDLPNLDLTGQQKTLLDDVIGHRRSGNVPIILLLFTGSPVLLSPNMSIDAIIECFFPAQAAGEAVRRILWNEGIGSNPAGRLPFTWQASAEQVPDMVDYAMVNRTYRYWEMDSPSFPFGYGLSYSKFEYSNLTISNENLKISENLQFQVSVTNKGPYDGDEVTQAYISWINPPEPMPKLQLVAFDRQSLRKDEIFTWKANVTASQMAIYFDNGGFQQVQGDLVLHVGGQQPNQEVNVGSNVLEAKFTVI